MTMLAHSTLPQTLPLPPLLSPVVRTSTSAPAGLRPVDAFQDLVQDLSDLLGPSSGIDSADVNPQELVDLMKQYTSNPDEWARYAFSDPSRGYTRNLVDKGNGKSNLLLLVWSPGKGSPIHDHANAHCVMKVLKGTLKETLYTWPEQDKAPQVIRETLYPTDGVTYMSDQLGLHKVSNPDPDNFAISLHLYTPPNAEHFGCRIFDPKTGRSSRVKQCEFFSVTGRKL